MNKRQVIEGYAQITYGDNSIIDWIADTKDVEADGNELTSIFMEFLGLEVSDLRFATHDWHGKVRITFELLGEDEDDKS